MRITFFAPAPLDLLTGGYVYNRRMVELWRGLGHEVELIGLAGSHPLADDQARAAAAEALAKLPPDAIPVMDNLALPAFAPLADELRKRGAVLLDHHPTGLESGLDPAVSAGLIDIERRIIPYYRRIVVPSPTMAEVVARDFGATEAQLAIIVPGLDDAPRSKGSQGAGVHVLSIGSLIPRKGHDVLLKSLARLFDLDWRLTIAGTSRLDPDYAAGLKALPAELGIAERVRFLPETTGQALADLWDSADLFALATRYEGFGMVIAEALRRGLPVLVANGGAAAALLNPECGVVCQVDDVDQTSKALRRLIFDTRLRHEMAEGAWLAGQSLPRWQQQAEAFASILV